MGPAIAGSGDATTVEGVLDLVRQQGGRVTSSRRLLLRALFDSKDHHTAEELAAEVQQQSPDIHLSTIYRNLDELERLGVIVHSHLGHGAATYHLAASAHGHFVCEECGQMIEAPDNLFASLAMLGRCAKCR
jgi:Fe2+ or Zn2+ uptake regulation protein